MLRGGERDKGAWNRLRNGGGGVGKQGLAAEGNGELKYGLQYAYLGGHGFVSRHNSAASSPITRDVSLLRHSPRIGPRQARDAS